MALVLLDFDVDTSKPTGRLVAHVLAAVAEFERQRIRERTREALAQVKAQGNRLGRPRQLPDEVVARVEANRDAGRTLARIADDLNGNNFRTAAGGRQWWPSTVAEVLRSIELDRAIGVPGVENGVRSEMSSENGSLRPTSWSDLHPNQGSVAEQL